MVIDYIFKICIPICTLPLSSYLMTIPLRNPLLALIPSIEPLLKKRSWRIRVGMNRHGDWISHHKFSKMRNSVAMAAQQRRVSARIEAARQPQNTASSQPELDVSPYLAWVHNDSSMQSKPSRRNKSLCTSRLCLAQPLVPISKCTPAPY